MSVKKMRLDRADEKRLDKLLLQTSDALVVLQQYAKKYKHEEESLAIQSVLVAMCFLLLKFHARRSRKVEVPEGAFVSTSECADCEGIVARAPTEEEALEGIRANVCVSCGSTSWNGGATLAAMDRFRELNAQFEKAGGGPVVLEEAI